MHSVKVGSNILYKHQGLIPKVIYYQFEKKYSSFLFYHLVSDYMTML